MPDGDREPVHRLEDVDEVVLLGCPVTEEEVLDAAQPDPFGTELPTVGSFLERRNDPSTWVSRSGGQR